MPETLPEDPALWNMPVGRASYAMMKHTVLTFTFPVTVVMRRSALEAIGGFQHPDYLPLVDFPTFLRIGLEGTWRFHDRILGYWRRHESSITLSRFPWILNGVYRHVAEFYAKFHNRLPASEEEIAELQRAWAYFQADRTAILGRWMASEKKWRQARAYFRKAQQFPIGKRTKMMFRMADRLAILRLSPEPAFQLGRRPDWRTAFKVHTGDVLVSPQMTPDEFVPYFFNLEPHPNQGASGVDVPPAIEMSR